MRPSSVSLMSSPSTIFGRCGVMCPSDDRSAARRGRMRVAPSAWGLGSRHVAYRPLRRGRLRPRIEGRNEPARYGDAVEVRGNMGLGKATPGARLVPVLVDMTEQPRCVGDMGLC